MGLYLYLDTSIAGFCLGILQCDNSNVSIASFEVMEERKSTAKSLTKSFELQKNKLNFQTTDFAGVVCAIGPGTFTGLRIGLAWAYGLFGLSKVEFLQTSTTELLAKKYKRKVLLPATKEKGYLSVSDKSSVAIQLNEPRSLQLHSVVSERLCHIGWEFFEELLGKECQDMINLSPNRAMQEALEFFCELFNQGQKEQFLSDSFPQPNYIRLSTAEERLQQQSSKT